MSGFRLDAGIRTIAHMKRLMKKRILASALCLPLLLALCSPVLAAQTGKSGFFGIGSAPGVAVEPLSESGTPVSAVFSDVNGDGAAEDFYPGSTGLMVTVSETQSGALYLLRLLDAGTGEVLFVDQKPGGGALSFYAAVLPPDRGTELKLTLTSSADGFEPAAIPLSYAPSASGSPATEDSGLSPARECGRDESCPLTVFSDLDRGAWYHDGIHYALAEGLMNGYDGGMFLPDEAASRAMIVTILWRMAGKPQVGGTASFADVPAEAWYYEAVCWGVRENLVAGYGNKRFGPDDPVTREQLAVILFRAVRILPGAGGSEDGADGAPAFSDMADVSDWASEAVRWMTGKGILRGTDAHRLSPQANASRAQIAAMLMRLFDPAEGE